MPVRARATPATVAPGAAAVVDGSLATVVVAPELETVKLVLTTRFVPFAPVPVRVRM